ncbi:uncharacterized protein LOC109513132 [Hippocampus comes]|uniref:uncharacterized protein LOC109513132 n=1 Tax=Hippocampus comes TaxID=109280 RepID=UPI00094ECEF7|nr:PREDICTED: uncharacterized protein LOC109513132 [Hippocampus comes]
MMTSLYLMSYYTAELIISGDKKTLPRHCFPKENLNSYKGILSFVNVNNNHWKLLYIKADTGTVYLVDPAQCHTEVNDSTTAAKRFREFLTMRRTHHGKAEWEDKEWKGGCLAHPTQQDSSSCGVIVTLIAAELMKTFPKIPHIKFDSSTKEMANERTKLGLEILAASVSDPTMHCAMCSLGKPPGAGPPLINWIQCDECERWYHEQCLGMTVDDLAKARTGNWSCVVCEP